MPDLIPQNQLKNSKIYSSRYDFIRDLPQNISYIEAGVLAGDFSDFVLNTINPKKCFLVDTFCGPDFHAQEYGGARWTEKDGQYEFVKNRFKNKDNVTLIKKPFEEFVKSNNEKFDLVYLDYDTDYQSVVKQIRYGIMILNDEGILGFNDYNIYFNNGNGEKMGVVPAINEFLRNNPQWEVFAFALNDNLTSDIYLKKTR